ncbi:hypothetical protein ACFYN0_17175 [Streptomyces sp. NPDC006704]|uniref:hypothetical protein n=1 Tax=Streptomyces sp. NPDC006704 TaxID=3364760 RepID=UPI0036D00BB6
MARRERHVRSAAAPAGIWTPETPVHVSRPKHVVALDTTPLPVGVMDDVFAGPLAGRPPAVVHTRATLVTFIAEVADEPVVTAETLEPIVTGFLDETAPGSVPSTALTLFEPDARTGLKPCRRRSRSGRVESGSIPETDHRSQSWESH